MTTKPFYVGLDEYRTRSPELADLLEKVLTIDTSGSTPKIVFKLGTNIVDVVANLDAAIKGGVSNDGNTLKKLRDLISDLANTQVADKAELNAKIASVIENNDPAAIDSLKELLDKLNQGDGNLADAIAALGTGTNSAIAAEQSRAEGAEAQLQSNLDTEISRAQQAEQDLQDSINQEAGSRVSADNQLQSNIDALDDWAVQQVDTLTQNLNNEVAARQAAVTAEVVARDAAIAVETARAQAAEAQQAADLANAIADLTIVAQDGIEKTGNNIKVKVEDIIDGDLLVKNANGDITLAEYIQPRVI